MKRVETNISYGYLPLIQIFADANNLNLKFEPRHKESEDSHYPTQELLDIIFEENSDTDITITFMSVKNLGFENMLCDYLKRCNVDYTMIPIGKAVMRKSDEQMEKEWQEHKKKIGL